MNYKVGDKVVCINPIGAPFQNGQILIITGVSREFLSFNHDNYKWSSNRFNLHETMMQIITVEAAIDKAHAEAKKENLKPSDEFNKTCVYAEKALRIQGTPLKDRYMSDLMIKVRIRHYGMLEREQYTL